MTLKLTSTLSQQTPQQDPFLRWKQSRPLDVSLERCSDNASPKVAVSLAPKPGAWVKKLQRFHGNFSRQEDFFLEEASFFGCIKNMQPDKTPSPCQIASSPKESGTPSKTLNVASSSTGFHSGSIWKTSKISSEKTWRAIADSLRKALLRILKPWISNSTLSKMRTSTFKRRRSMSQTKTVPP